MYINVPGYYAAFFFPITPVTESEFDTFRTKVLSKRSTIDKLIESKSASN